MSLGLIAAAMLCCAAPVPVGMGLAAVALGAVRQPGGWLTAGVAVVAAAVFLLARDTGRA